MAHCSESSGGGRARSRSEAQRTTRIAPVGFDPVGELSGFPLVPCPECGLARVVEGRTKKDSENHGRLYFKCPRNGYPKLCPFYRFEKEYFQVLKDHGVVVVRPSNWMQLVTEEDSVESPDDNKNSKVVEQKLNDVIWKMNVFMVCVICVLLACVFMYAVKK